MKKLTAGIVLIFWMIFTIVLIISVLGMVVILEEDEVWMNIGKNLTKTIIS